MAFVDTLLTDTDATMIVVDRRHRPGGHWNDAYPFVRLHPPSALYGVESRPLGSGRIEQSGPNRGLLELASGAEILDYYDRLMRERLLPSQSASRSVQPAFRRSRIRRTTSCAGHGKISTKRRAWMFSDTSRPAPMQMP